MGIKDNPTEIQLIKYWYNYATSLLTSSSIVFVFVGKYFKKVEEMVTVLVFDVDFLLHDFLVQDHQNTIEFKAEFDEVLPKLVERFNKNIGFACSNILDAKNDWDSKKMEIAFSKQLLPPVASVYPSSSREVYTPETSSLTDFTLEDLKEPVEKCQNLRSLFELYKGNAACLSDTLELYYVSSENLFKGLVNAERVPDSNAKMYRECFKFLKDRYILVMVSLNDLGGVVPVMAKLLLYRLAEFFKAENLFCVTSKTFVQLLSEKIISSFPNKRIILFNTIENCQRMEKWMGVKCSFISSIQELIHFVLR
uniref:Uncharacterized protein n=1 Tax=Meloidogyne enterolobii TaxID=390850 RepID=A0A6V7WYY8_MELEN|nr:unnamed protein product [Meloidogyne enterolobii]